ncbi:prephenate dehydratase [Halorubellus sp. JP-L1]|uniref:prephenate dehydratase n=1 Tax=Halorubellus sp. JP-L1 TaxID=2715753 RepID=UPI001409545F|nr:prephenate dehydratase [Halorubellus sp. JP-L1]NHN43484.1 prephenate dehydratase [Halorubellus sp. JP-L1]
MSTVTLGPSGTYSHRAARAVSDGEVSFRESVTSIVEAVASGAADRGVVPIENSIEGSVTETLDALAEYDVAVTQEVVTPIKHALLAQGEGFDVVASHPQALAQCREYLDEQYPGVEREAVASTAAGVERARNDPAVAAIAHPGNADETDSSENAAGEPGAGALRVLAEDVQDRTSNATRFFVIARPEARSEAGGKSTFVVYPNANYPGLLLELLEPFADRDVNLTRVESRPSGERLGDYCFHVDVEAGLYEDRTQAALDVVRDLCENGWVRELGSYDVRTVVS